MMDTSADIFSSQFSSYSCHDVGVREVRRFFCEPVYRVSDVDQTVWVLFKGSSCWKLYRTTRRTEHQISVDDFVPCASISVDHFMKEITEELDADPFADEPASVQPPSPPVIRLVSSEASHDLKISDLLFALLFKQEAVLSSKSNHHLVPCLIGLPDGRVLFWHPTSAKETPLLCHMYQPVLDIIVGPEGCLLFVGQQGKVICVSPHREGAVYSMLFLHGTVTTCCFTGRHLYYTTFSYQLWRSTIILDDQGQAKASQHPVKVDSAKKVQYDRVLDKVTYVNAHNVLYDLPDDISVSSVPYPHEQLLWLSSKISEQSDQIQHLSEVTEKHSSLLHDLTCAAWLLTSEKCGLKCQYKVQPVPGERSTFNITVTFSELGKLCPSGLWSVSCLITKNSAPGQTKVSKTMPVHSDVVYLDLSVPVTFGPKSQSWGGCLRPPLAAECSVLFTGVSPCDPVSSRSCPAMKFLLETFVLDEFCFLTQKNLGNFYQPESQDVLILDIAKQKAREKLEEPLITSFPGKVQCSINIMTMSGENVEDYGKLIWQKVLPERLWTSEPRVFNLLDHEVRLWMCAHSGSAEEEARHLSLYIETDCPSLLSGLRASAASRVSSTTMLEEPNIEVSVDVGAVTKAQVLQSELQILKKSSSFQKVLQFYLKLRNEFSSKLPTCVM